MFFAGACVAAAPSPTASATATAAPQGSTITSVADLKSLFTPNLPAGALEIPAAVGSAKVGETIIVHGHIPRAESSLSAQVAEFTLVGPGGNKAAAPGNAARRVAVRVVTAAGEILKGSLSGKYGLKPGAEVFVTGTVVAVDSSATSADGPPALILNARSIHAPRGPLPAGFISDAPAEGARDISEARASGTIKKGDTVVLRGRVGGSAEPFVAGRALFTLVGRGLKPCNERPDDHCTRPWDYCCDPQDEILAHSVTVQIVDSKGQPLRTDMKGRRGLKELSEVVVVGEVTVADGKAVVITATSLAVVAQP